MLFAQELDTEYQSYFSREIVRYYQKKEQKPLVEQYLEQADYEQMPQAVRQYMMESLADWRMYDRLYEQMQEYGLDHRQRLQLPPICWMRWKRGSRTRNCCFCVQVRF